MTEIVRRVSRMSLFGRLLFRLLLWSPARDWSFLVHARDAGPHESRHQHNQPKRSGVITCIGSVAEKMRIWLDSSAILQHRLKGLVCKPKLMSFSPVTMVQLPPPPSPCLWSTNRLRTSPKPKAGTRTHSTPGMTRWGLSPFKRPEKERTPSVQDPGAARERI
jgi:hypothetical protein